MPIATTAYGVGNIVGVLILVAVGFGVLRTLMRKDKTLREKILGSRRPKN